MSVSVPTKSTDGFDFDRNRMFFPVSEASVQPIVFVLPDEVARVTQRHLFLACCAQPVEIVPLT